MKKLSIEQMENVNGGGFVARAACYLWVYLEMQRKPDIFDADSLIICEVY